jgi:hypothetical protein
MLPDADAGQDRRHEPGDAFNRAWPAGAAPTFRPAPWPGCRRCRRRGDALRCHRGRERSLHPAPRLPHPGFTPASLHGSRLRIGPGARTSGKEAGMHPTQSSRELFARPVTRGLRVLRDAHRDRMYRGRRGILERSGADGAGVADFRQRHRPGGLRRTHPRPRRRAGRQQPARHGTQLTLTPPPAPDRRRRAHASARECCDPPRRHHRNGTTPAQPPAFLQSSMRHTCRAPVSC